MIKFYNFCIVYLQVLPVFVQYLPLREDFDENFHVFKCLDLIYRQGSEFIIPLLEKITAVSLQVLYKKQHKNDGTYNCFIQSLVF